MDSIGYSLRVALRDEVIGTLYVVQPHTQLVRESLGVPYLLKLVGRIPKQPSGHAQVRYPIRHVKRVAHIQRVDLTGQGDLPLYNA